MFDKKTGIQIMNQYSQEREPFLFVIDYRLEKIILRRQNEIDPRKILFQFNKFAENTGKSSRKVPVINRTKPVSFEEYRTAFDRVQQEIKNGNTYLLNLTFQTPIDIQATLSEIYHSVHSKYKIVINNEFVSFSPETFIKIQGDRIFSYPMKGTIDAALPGAKEILLNDPKEKAEHYTIVDLIRNDLSRVAEKVSVEKFRYISTVEAQERNLLQVSSEIVGKLRPAYRQNIGDMLAALLPAGSVTGAPKKKTCAIINEVENYPRHFYTGVAGYFDGYELDSCVLIRFIENHNGKFYFKSGGGITAYSRALDEYQELLQKVYIAR